MGWQIELLRPILLRSLMVAMEAYQQLNKEDVGELKLTFLLTWESKVGSHSLDGNSNLRYRSKCSEKNPIKKP